MSIRAAAGEPAIEGLDAGSASAIGAHLLRLSADDRALRFACAVSDETLCKYVASIRFDADLVLGVRDTGRLVAFAHATGYRVADGGTAFEASFSVDAERRGAGLASRLLAEVAARAGAAGGSAVVGQCLARNRPMRRVFVRAGMAIEVDRGDVYARGATTMRAWPVSAPTPPDRSAPAARRAATDRVSPSGST